VATDVTRTITSSELRDPAVLAEAANSPVAVIDGRRQESLILTSRVSFDTGQRLHDYTSLLARAVVELGRNDPSPAALGEAGYVADWLPADRAWWLRGFAEAISISVADRSTDAVSGFVKLARDADSAPPSPLEAPIDASLFTDETAAKLKPRS
jgi:hypothetical protein